MKKAQSSEYYDIRDIRNADLRGIASEGLEDILEAGNSALKTYNLAITFTWVFLALGIVLHPLFAVAILCLAFAIYVRKKKIVLIRYSFNEEQIAVVEKRMDPLVRIANCNRHWWITQKSKVSDKKYHAGASGAARRAKCKASTKPPFPFKTNSVSVSFRSGTETLLFLPDKLIVYRGSKIGALNYKDIAITMHKEQFVERDFVPKDTKIVDYTWEYVNKSGGPDRRFKKNRRLPICLYGEMEIRSKNGVNTDIMFSNPRIVK